MKDTKTTILTHKPINFKTRFLKSLIAPWVFLMIGLLFVFSWIIPFMWILLSLFVLTFVLMNYRAMKQYVMKIEIGSDCVELTYVNFDSDVQLLKIPKKELRVNYYSNGKGFSSLVSDHIRLEHKGKTLIKQFKTVGWTLELLKSTTKQLKEIRNERG